MDAVQQMSSRELIRLAMGRMPERWPDAVPADTRPARGIPEPRRATRMSRVVGHLPLVGRARARELPTEDLTEVLDTAEATTSVAVDTPHDVVVEVVETAPVTPGEADVEVDLEVDIDGATSPGVSPFGCRSLWPVTFPPETRTPTCRENPPAGPERTPVQPRASPSSALFPRVRLPYRWPP